MLAVWPIGGGVVGGTGVTLILATPSARLVRGSLKGRR
jgi:hypothetical protein